MRIIHEGLGKALATGALDTETAKGHSPPSWNSFITEGAGFCPDADGRGRKRCWLDHGRIRRPGQPNCRAARQSPGLLEKQADRIFTAREPDPHKREESMLACSVRPHMCCSRDAKVSGL